MLTPVRLILSVLLASLLLSARPTSAVVSSSSGIYPNDPPAVAASHAAVADPQDRIAPSFLTTQDDAELPEAIQKALAELKGRREEVAALRLAVGARDEKIRILESIVAQQEQLITEWRTAATERADVNRLDAKIEASYRDSVARYAVELAAVRKDRDRQASAKKWWLAAGVVLGVLAGVLAAKD